MYLKLSVDTPECILIYSQTSNFNKNIKMKITFTAFRAEARAKKQLVLLTEIFAFIQQRT